jgi:hypothetical protein
MEIKTTAVEKALRLLEASGASFHVRLGNQEWGTAIATKSARKASKYPHGSLMAHVRPYITDVKANDAVAIPFGDFDVDSIYSTVTAHLTTNWGKGSYMVHKAKNQLEVLRLL